MHNGVKMEYNDENKKRLEQQALAGNRAAQSMLNTLNSDNYDNSMEINTSNNGVDFKNVQMEYHNDRTGKQFEKGDNVWRRNFRTKEGKDYINDFINLNFTSPSGDSSNKKDNTKKRVITNTTRQFKYTNDGKYDDFDVTNADHEQEVNDIKNYFSYESAEEAAKHFDTSGLGNIEALWNIYNKTKGTIDFDQFIADIKSGRRANDWDNDTYRLLKNFGFIGYDLNTPEEVDARNAAALKQLGFDPEKAKGIVTIDKDGNAVLTSDFMNSFGTEFGNKKGNYWFNDQFANMAVNGEDNPYTWLNGWTSIGGKLYRSDSQEVQDFLTNSGFTDKNKQNLYNDANGIMQSLWGNNIGYESYAPTSFHSDWMASKKGLKYRGLSGYDVGKDELGRENQLVEYFDDTDTRDAYGYINEPRYAILNGNGDFVKDVSLNELQKIGDVGAKAVTLNKLMDASEGKHFEGKYRQLFQGSNGLSDLQIFTDPKTGETFIQDGDLKGDQQGKAVKIPTEIANLLRDGKFYKYISSNKNAKNRFYEYLREMTATGFGSGVRSIIDFGGFSGIAPLLKGGTDNIIRKHNLNIDLKSAGYSSEEADAIQKLLHKWAYDSRDAFAEKGLGKSASERSARMIFSPAATQGFKKGGLIPKHALGDMIGESKASEGTTKVNKIQGRQESLKQSWGLGSKDSKQWTDVDTATAVALASDIGSLGLSFVPGANVLAAGAGAVGSTATFTADVKRDGFQMKDLGSYGLNLLMDAGTLIPFVGGAAKLGKAGKLITKAAPTLIKAASIYGLGDAFINTVKKISSGESFTLDDVRRIVNGISGGITLSKTGLLPAVTKDKSKPNIFKSNKTGEPDIKVDVDAIKKASKQDQLIELQSQITANYRKANKNTKLSDDDILKLYDIPTKKKLNLKKKFWQSDRVDTPLFESKSQWRPLTNAEIIAKNKDRNALQNWFWGTHGRTFNNQIRSGYTQYMHDVSGTVTPKRIYTNTINSSHFVRPHYYPLLPNITSPTILPEERYYPGTEPVYEFKKGGVLKAQRGTPLPQVVVPESVKQQLKAETQLKTPVNPGISVLNAAAQAHLKSGNGSVKNEVVQSGAGSLGRNIDWGTAAIKGLEVANFARALNETRKVKDLYNRKADALEKTQMSHLPEINMRFQDPGYHKYDSDVADLYMRTGYQNQQTSDPKLQAANMLGANKLAMDHMVQKNQALSANWSQYLNNYQAQKNQYNQANWDIDAKNAQIRNAATNLRLTGEADANTQRSQIFDKAVNALQSELTLQDRAKYQIEQQKNAILSSSAYASNPDIYKPVLTRLGSDEYFNTVLKGIRYQPVRTAKKGGKVERSVSEQMLLDNQKIVAKALEKMSDNTMKLILKALS